MAVLGGYRSGTCGIVQNSRETVMKRVAQKSFHNAMGYQEKNVLP